MTRRAASRTAAVTDSRQISKRKELQRADWERHVQVSHVRYIQHWKMYNFLDPSLDPSKPTIIKPRHKHRPNADVVRCISPHQSVTSCTRHIPSSTRPCPSESPLEGVDCRRQTSAAVVSKSRQTSQMTLGFHYPSVEVAINGTSFEAINWHLITKLK